jgi:hypothetical protein
VTIATTTKNNKSKNRTKITKNEATTKKLKNKIKNGKYAKEFSSGV